jgi:hypothetical protein
MLRRAAPLTLDEIDRYRADLEASVRAFYQSSAPSFRTRFFSYTADEVKDELERRLQEIDLNAIFNLLAATEALLRVDFLERLGRKKRGDALTKEFREIAKAKGAYVSLEEDILAAWKKQGGAPKRLIGDFVGALKLRHWLAHGRYWAPKLGRQYEYLTVKGLADDVIRALSL